MGLYGPFFMPKTPYKYLFFDLDRTLWDFEKNMSETMVLLYTKYIENLSDAGAQKFRNTFDQVHEMLWEQYRKGQINKKKLRESRFNITLKRIGIKNKGLAKVLNAQYLEICPTKTNLFPHTIETLEYLKKDYSLYILTNGFIKTQQLKLKNCGLEDYFKIIFSSEIIGYNKPDKRIFAQVVNSLNAKKEACIMIGDDIETDIYGAMKYGLDQIYFNPKNHSVKGKTPTFIIQSLKELIQIF